MHKNVVFVDLDNLECQKTLYENDEDVFNFGLTLYKEFDAIVLTFVKSRNKCSSVLFYHSLLSNKIDYAYFQNDFTQSFYNLDLDAIVIKGYARKLCYLTVTKDFQEISICENLRGCDSNKLEQIFDKKEMIYTSRAADNKNYLASLQDIDKEIGKSGLGLVFSIRNLKAIIGGENIVNDVLGDNTKNNKLRKEYKNLNSLINFGQKFSWVPSEYYSSSNDPRVEHLNDKAFLLKLGDKEYFPQMITLGSNLGYFSVDKVDYLYRHVKNLGLHSAGVGIILSYLKYSNNINNDYPKLNESKINDLIRICNSITDKIGVWSNISKGFAAFSDIINIANNEVILDLRAVPSAALFYKKGDTVLPYVDLMLNLKNKYSDYNIGIITAFMRVYTYALINNGIDPIQMVFEYFNKALKYTPDNQTLLIMACLKFKIFNIKSSDLLLSGFNSIEYYDELKGSDNSIDNMFLTEFTNDNSLKALNYTKLKLGYNYGIKKIRYTLCKKGSI